MASTTENLYVGNGSTVLYSFTFPYIEEDDIYITLDGTLTTEYTLANATTIEFNTAPTTGVAIRIYRLTDIDEVTATFFPGSAIRAQDLNADFEQTLYVAQEARNNAFRPDGTLPMVGDLDLGGYDIVNGGAQFNKTVDLANNRITGVAAPVDSTDAANRAYVDGKLTGGDTEIVSTAYAYYTATQGDTILQSGINGVPGFAITEGLEQVYLNGALQQTNIDYTSQSTSQITFTQPLLQDDVVAIHCINNINVSTELTGPYTYPGGVEQTVQDRLEQYVSVKDFGAKGDGVTDDTAAVKAALASGATILDFSKSTYLCSEEVTVPSIDIQTNCTFKFTSTNYLYLNGGGLSEVGSLSVASNKGSSSITLSSVAGLSVGDVLFISDPTPSSFSQHRTSYCDGQVCKVSGISGTTVVLDSALTSAYPQSTTRVYKSPSIKVNIDGLTVESESGSYALRVYGATDAVITNLHASTGGRNACLTLDRCFNATVRGGSVASGEWQSGDGSNYGLSIVNSQNILINKVQCFGGRHAVSSGGDAQPANVPVRYLTVKDCRLTNSIGSDIYCADFHGNTIDSVYESCIIEGRVGLAGFDCGVRNCVIKSLEGDARSPVVWHEVVGGTMFVEGCDVYHGDNNAAIACFGPASSTLMENVDSDYNIDITETSVYNLNSTVTQILTSTSGNTVNYGIILDKLNLGGDTSGLTSMIKFAKVGTGVDPVYAYIQNRRHAPLSVSYFDKSGVMASTIFKIYAAKGTTGVWDWNISETGILTLRTRDSYSTAISTSYLGGFRSGGNPLTFPFTFTEVPNAQLTSYGATSASAVVSSLDTSSINYFVCNPVTQATVSNRITEILLTGSIV